MRLTVDSDAPVILVPMVAGIGNGLLCVPMVRQLGRHWPKGRVFIAAATGAMGEVFRRLPEVAEVMVLGGQGLAALRGLRDVRRLKADLCVIPFPSNRWQYNCFAAACGARRRLIHVYPVGRLRTLAFLPATRVAPRPGLHDVTQNVRLLEALGVRPDYAEAPVFPLREPDRQAARRRLIQAGLDAEARPIIVYGGSDRSRLARAKRWPAERFGELIRRLYAECGRPIVVIEGPDSTGIAEAVIARSGSCAAAGIRVDGPLGETAALLERALLYVGPDSGLAHLAAAVGTPTVTLFAPTDPDRVCPFGQQAGVVRPAGLSCMPCYQYPWRSVRPKVKCRGAACLSSIAASEVMGRIQLILPDP